MRSTKVLLLACTILAACTSLLAGQPQKHILYINSYHTGFSWTDEVTKGILDYFSQVEGVHVHTEFMDAKRNTPETVTAYFLPYLSQKFAVDKPNLIIVSDNSALDLVLAHRHTTKLFKDVPIVFAGISNPDDYPLESEDLYGVVEIDMFVASFEMMRKLYPNFRTVYLFLDRTNTGYVYRQNAENLLMDYPEYKLVIMDSIYLKGLDTTMAGIKGNSMVYYQGVSIDGAGNVVDHYDVARRIFKHAKVPVFTSYALDVKGSTGGQFIGGYEHGKLCGQLAHKRLMAKAIAKRLHSPPLSGVFDYSKLIEYNLDPSQLPTGATLINKPDTVWEKYRKLIIINLSVMGVMAMAIAMLLWHNKAQKRAKRLMEKAMEKAVETDKLKGAFLANVSHELRTPLNAICGFSELAKTENNDPIISDYLTVIHENSDLLSELVNDLLDISLIDANAVTVRKTKTDLLQVFGTLEMQTHSLLKLRQKEHIQIHSQCNPTYRHIHTDAFRVSQIMLNLINNAIKYTEQGSITFGFEHAGQVVDWINVSPPGDAFLVLYVKDTGIGIDEEKQPLVFDRFRRVDTMFVSHHGGVGLGLNISRSLVEMLGGQIFVQSRKGVGSTFGFFLPL